MRTLCGTILAAIATVGLAYDRMTQPCPQDDCCMLQEGNLQNQVFLRRRVFACLASIALANAPDSNLRFSGSAYLANAPQALSCLGNVIAIGMECVKTHCRAKMRSASANDVPSSRNSCSASCLSAEFIRNCITVDFVASMSNSSLFDFAYNYTTNVLQMQGGIERQQRQKKEFLTIPFSRLRQGYGGQANSRLRQGFRRRASFGGQVGGQANSNYFLQLYNLKETGNCPLGRGGFEGRDRKTASLGRMEEFKEGMAK